MQTSYRSYCIIEERMVASFRQLGIAVPASHIEAMASKVFRAMSRPTRVFHSVGHILELSEHVDALGCLAALYHDCIYLQLDGGFGDFAEGLKDLCRYDQGRVYFQAIPEEQSVLCGLCEIFDVPLSGGLLQTQVQNEFVSALVAVLELQPYMTERDLFMIAACIEATIPFRDDLTFPQGLADRLHIALQRIGRGAVASDVDEAMFRAIDLANRDVENFSSEHVEEFLKNTWLLISEGSPELQEVACSVRVCRSAIEKMHGFLESLRPEHVYRGYKGCPPGEELAQKTAAAHKNLSMARCYLKAQLCSLYVMDAIAHETGGDTLLCLFSGDEHAPTNHSEAELKFLEKVQSVSPVAQIDPVLLQLLRTPYAKSSILTYCSPLAAFLYHGLGNKGLETFRQSIELYSREKLSSLELLQALPQVLVLGLLDVARQVMTLRKDAVVELIDKV